MHERGRQPDEKPGSDAPAETASSPTSGPSLLTEIGQLGRAIKTLFGAQFQLLAAELGLARSAVSWLLVASLAATVAGVGLGLTALGLIGLLLAQWLGSWVWALLALLVLQGLFLFGALVLFRRCVHWMSLPASRGAWGAMMHDTMDRARTKIDATNLDTKASEKGSR